MFFTFFAIISCFLVTFFLVFLESFFWKYIPVAVEDFLVVFDRRASDPSFASSSTFSVRLQILDVLAPWGSRCSLPSNVCSVPFGEGALPLVPRMVLFI